MEFKELITARRSVREYEASLRPRKELNEVVRFF